MSETNKTYRIKTEVGNGANESFINIDTNILQDYNTLDILSIKIQSADTYRLHNSNYGVVVGRVLANNGFGIPNAKLSIFIESDSKDGDKVRELYPFVNSSDKDTNKVRYNLLPDNKVGDCHQIVGTFPNKRYMLDNDVVLEVFDKYYKYTTKTNNGGDYLIMGVPVGSHTLHMDLDLSDCGILSQKPRDFVYKGYTIEQFENPSMFKGGTNYPELSQVFTQDQVITVRPFWGDESQGESVGLTRTDINVSFKFEPTCVFMGCVISDNSSNGITKKCKATENMGNMEELTTGEGTIEMIRKTPSGDIESFQIKGTELINGDGVWCYQIPMNLDYMMTDEYGNMVPTDDPEKGIPTRTSVRFRMSMQDNEENIDNYFRCKVLVPHNPQVNSDGTHEDYDYEFGTFTRDDSFRDLFWDNVYTVKSYIPRFQKRKVKGWNDKHFTGIKNCNFYGNNNPMPYNNIRIKLPLMFTILCALIKGFIFVTSLLNFIIIKLGNALADIGNTWIFGYPLKGLYRRASELKLNSLVEGLCPDLENWFFAPVLKNTDMKSPKPPKDFKRYNILEQTLDYLVADDVLQDTQSVDYNNKESEDGTVCLTTKIDYLIECIEMNLAMEYRVINFDFYNDWINGPLYIPRFMRFLRPKKTFLGIRFAKAKIKGCMDDPSIFSKTRRYTQQCSMEYKIKNENNKQVYIDVNNPLNKNSRKKTIKKANNFHKKSGFNQVTIMGKNGGICHEHTTSRKQNVYYMKPCEWKGNSKVNLFATDIVLLGSLKSCNENGLPQAFKYLSSSSYVMPTNLALTNMETSGPLYANGKDTICAGVNNTKLVSEDYGDDLKVINPNEGIISELEAYSKTKDSNIDTNYEGNELTDLIPLTEAAGISWGYTGPGQGERNDANMYHPGGHFLDLSCANSATNIKSCINLSRICEVGSNLSQRKEDIKYDEKGNATYINKVPTGFISGDDIMGEDFRTMFATLNHNRLQATKLQDNGYYYYDLDYLKPINFDGSFYVMANRSEYNKNLGADKINNDDKLNKYGIASRDRFLDNESNSSVTSITKTIEDTSIDYYRFRFGLDYSELTNKNIKHNSKFLASHGSYKYLPQYENSYYFYFGMKAGASAIDEFNKQFFSTCETTTIAHGNPIININVKNINFCNGTGEFEVILDNIELPSRSIMVTYNNGGKDESIEITSKYKNNYIFSYSGNFGTYTISVIDSNGISLTKKIELGIDLFSYTLTKHNFNVQNASNYKNQHDIFRGGYIEVSNFLINKEYGDYIKKSNLFVSGTTNKTYSKKIEIATTEEIEKEKSNISQIFIDESNVDFNLYLKYQCENQKEVTVYLDSFRLNDGSSVTLNMGWNNGPLYLEVSPKAGSYNFICGEDNVTQVNGNFYFGNEWKNPADNITQVEDWIKSVCTKKTVPDNMTFSNNVFALNGNKVLWGSPQNQTGVCDVTICTETEDESEYTGYSLDDDASYHETKVGRNYSALAINNDIVSGDYFGYISGGTYHDNNKNNVDIPRKNTGFVFKELPDGELHYFVYPYDNKNESYLEDISSGLTGIFYSSFEYPVIDSKFEVNAKFYIWGMPTIYKSEIEDSEPEILNEEYAGRTEATIRGGIRYNGKLGDGSNISNVSKLNGEGNNIIITGTTGMMVGLSTEDDKGNDIIVYQSAYTEDNNNKYCKGFTGITEASYEIIEGYPDLSLSGINASNYVNTLSEFYEYSNLFPKYVKYEHLQGKNPVIYYDAKYDNIEGFICYQNIDTKINLLTVAGVTNNNYFIYLKIGEKEPTYYVLCKYIKNSNLHSSPEGGLTFITISFYNQRRYNLFFDYLTPYKTVKDEEGDLVEEGGDKATFKLQYHEGKLHRNNIYNLINGKNGPDLKKINDVKLKKWKGGDYDYHKYMEPVINYRIKADISEWETAINEHKENYNNYSQKTKGLTNSNNNIFYYVAKAKSNGETNSSLYKIYPCLWKANRTEWDDNIYDFSTYSIIINGDGRIKGTEDINGDPTTALTITGYFSVDKSIVKEESNAKKYLRISYGNGNEINVEKDGSFSVDGLFTITFNKIEPNNHTDTEYNFKFEFLFKVEDESNLTDNSSEGKLYIYINGADKNNSPYIDIIKEEGYNRTVYLSQSNSKIESIPVISGLTDDEITKMSSDFRMKKVDFENKYSNYYCYKFNDSIENGNIVKNLYLFQRNYDAEGLKVTYEFKKITASTTTSLFEIVDNGRYSEVTLDNHAYKLYTKEISTNNDKPSKYEIYEVKSIDETIPGTSYSIDNLILYKPSSDEQYIEFSYNNEYILYYLYDRSNTDQANEPAQLQYNGIENINIQNIKIYYKENDELKELGGDKPWKNIQYEIVESNIDTSKQCSVKFYSSKSLNNNNSIYEIERKVNEKEEYITLVAKYENNGTIISSPDFKVKLQSYYTFNIKTDGSLEPYNNNGKHIIGIKNKNFESASVHIEDYNYNAFFDTNMPYGENKLELELEFNRSILNDNPSAGDLVLDNSTFIVECENDNKTKNYTLFNYGESEVTLELQKGEGEGESDTVKMFNDFRYNTLTIKQKLPKKFRLRFNIFNQDDNSPIEHYNINIENFAIAGITWGEEEFLEIHSHVFNYENSESINIYLTYNGTGEKYTKYFLNIKGSEDDNENTSGKNEKEILKYNLGELYNKVKGESININIPTKKFFIKEGGFTDGIIRFTISKENE